MKYRDENGKDGRYSGDVNEDHEPHGQGKMKYKDGTAFTGVWSDGVAVHGKSSVEKRSGKLASSTAKEKTKDQWSNTNPTSSASGIKVRKMKWMDYYGDPGEYTGQVDESNMPNGRGSMKYDHGLIQEGLWSKGQFVEGSDVVEQNGGERSREVRRESTRKKESGTSRGVKSRRDP
jgi:hypothetical protein